MALKNHIPNTITSMNLLCGVMGVIFTIEGRIDIAFPLMILGAVFDFFDGLAARLLKAYSNIGKELDSLADMVTFGVLPSVLLYKTMVNTSGQSFWCYIPLLIAVFSALRLAKFNLDERQHSSFLGLPTPACAMICGSLAYYIYVTPDTAYLCLFTYKFYITAATIILCELLVCELPMFSMKFGTNEKTGKLVNIIRIIFFALSAVYAVVILALSLNWSLIIFWMFLTYILLNVFLYLFMFYGKEAKQQNK